ncbi:MAG: DNA polymerase III subunit delta [Sphaerochaetaceae bacterium]|nr:DNA polymerase III subunit delta [Sphaerochaetaceae bacterium]
MVGNVALLMGSEEGLKQEWIDREKQVLLDTYPDLEIVPIFAFESDGGDLSEALEGSFLFSSHKLVMLRHFEEAKKTSPLYKVLVQYLKNPNEDCHLMILTTQRPSEVGAEITKALSKEQQIVFYEMFENKKEEWLRNYFRREGLNITREAISLLLDTVSNDTLEMRENCSQLVSFIKAKGESNTITEEDISKYTAHTRSEDGYSLFEHMADGDFERSLKAIRKILSSDPRSGIAVMAILQRQFRLLESFLSIRKVRGEAAAFSEATILGTSASGREVKGIMRMSQDTFRRAARKYTQEDASRIIRYLDSEDLEIRKSSDNQSFLFDMLVYTIVVLKARKTSLTLERELMENSFTDR